MYTIVSQQTTENDIASSIYKLKMMVILGVLKEQTEKI